MTPEQIDVVRLLRTAGYAVTIFAPDEVGDVDPSAVEDAMCEAGWRQIEWEKGYGHTPPDSSDDAAALASAGHGTDEDYGYAEDVL